MWYTLFTLNLNEATQSNKPKEIRAYIQQLKGIPDSWKKGVSSPYRSINLSFNEYCKKHRDVDEQIIPDCVISYLNYLWERTDNAPFENHVNRILSRIGIFSNHDVIRYKISKYNKLLGNKPIGKHKKLIQLGKIVCLSKEPRCDVCPLIEECNHRVNQ